MAKTIDQITTELISFIVANFNPRLVDTRIGSVLRDAFISPVSVEFEAAFSDIDQVSSNQSIAAPDEISTENMDNLAANFGVSRFSGSPAVGLVRFFKVVLPTSNITIPAGTRIATTETNDVSAREFRTLASVQLTPLSPPDPVSGADAYVEVGVQCSVNGPAGNIDAGTLTSLLDPIAGVDGVINPSGFSGGKDFQTNTEMAELVKARAQGRLGTKSGYRDAVLSNFSVLDVEVIGQSDPEATRDQFGGEVDVVVLSQNSADATEAFAYVDSVTTLQLVPTFRPLLAVAFLTGFDSLANLITLIGPAGGVGVGGVGSDYDVILDTSGPHAGSYQENSKIVLHPTTNIPADGSVLTITYQNNDLIRVIQAFFFQEDNLVIGADVLAKSGVKISANVTASIRVIPGFSTTSVVAEVESALQAKFASFLLGDDVQASDIISVIAGVGGVDYVDIPTFLMALTSAPLVPLQEINARKNEHIALSLISITVI